jgi:hypothetical protein
MLARSLSLIAILFAVAPPGCSEERPAPRAEPAQPRAVKLRHRFEVGRVLRYETKTVERGPVEITIETQTQWQTLRRRPDGAGEVEVTIARYRQQAFPSTQLASEAAILNERLAGARFRMVVSADGRDVEHLGHEGVPEVSDFSVEALRTTLRSVVLRLPDDPLRSGQRWTVEHESSPDAGAAAITSRSQWRVLSVRPRGREQLVELVCLSTMEPEELRLGEKLVRNRTEFHYDYLWNATAGALERMTSSGSTLTVSRPLESADAGPLRRERVRFEARVRKINEIPRI